MRAQAAISAALNRALIGTEQSVLVCGEDQRGRLYGRLPSQAPEIDGVIYLGGAATLQDTVTRSVFARIAASQSQHLSVFSRIVLDRPVGVAFPPALGLEDGSTALDPFIS